jgi:hypothetical protein
MINDRDEKQRTVGHLSQTVISQSNYLFAALCAYIKLEWLRKATKLNHFFTLRQFLFNWLRKVRVITKTCACERMFVFYRLDGNGCYRHFVTIL